MKADQVIKAYIEKIMEIQDERRNRLPDRQELRELVEELGFSELEYHWIQKEFEEHYKNGEGFYHLENWREAIKEYEQALLINPYDAPTLAHLAAAYKKLWEEDSKKEYRQKAKTFARLCLKINPGYPPALKVIDQISRYEYNLSKTQGLVLISILFFSIMFYFILKLFI